MELRSIAQKFSITDFCAAITPLLDQPRSKGKKQEEVPGVGERGVQTRDIKQTRIALQKTRAETSSSPNSMVVAGTAFEEPIESPSQETRTLRSNCYAVLILRAHLLLISWLRTCHRSIIATQILRHQSSETSTVEASALRMTF